MLPVTVGKAVLHFLENKKPVTNQALREYFEEMLKKESPSPISDWTKAALDLLNHSEPER